MDLAPSRRERHWEESEVSLEREAARDRSPRTESQGKDLGFYSENPEACECNDAR